MKRLPFFLIVLAVLSLLYCPDVLAQDQTQQRFDGILDAFRDQAVRWQGTLMLSARWLFFTLAIAQFAYTNMRIAVKGGDFAEFISTNTTWLLGTGMMYVFLIHSYDWSHALIKGFMQAGERAVLASAAGSAGAMDPASVLQNGLVVAGSLFGQMSVWSGIDNVGLLICALCLVACFALLAAWMAVTIVESYIVIGASVLFLGFGGSSWTADIAKKTIMYAVSCGAKLFVMQLIVGVAMGSVIQWAQTYEQDSSTNTMALIALVLLITILAKMIPDLVQGLLSGISTGGSAAMLSTIAAATAAVAAGAAAATAGAGGVLAAGGAGAATGGAGSAAGAAGATSGAQGAASLGGAAESFKSAGGHAARMGGHLVDVGAGVNPNAAMGPMSAVGRSTAGAGGSGSGGGGSADGASNDASPPGSEPGVDPKPAPPDLPSSGSPDASSSPETGGGNASASGGLIRGAGEGTAAPLQAAASQASSGGTSSAANAQSSTGDSPGGEAGLPAGGSSGASGSVFLQAMGSADTASGSSGSAAPHSLASDQLRQGQSAAPSESSPFAGQARPIDQRSDEPSDQAAGNGSGGAAASSLDVAASPPPSTEASSDSSASLPDSTGVSSLDVESSSSDGPPPLPPLDTRSARMDYAKKGALAGFVVAGPGGAAIGAAAGAVVGPKAKAMAAVVGPKATAMAARAAAALRTAKKRFNLE